MKNGELSIMIIEDDLIIAENLKESLIEMGYRVSAVANDYLTAKEAIETKKIDLFLVDIHLDSSDKNGIQIMAECNDSLIPVIYLSAYDDDEYRTMAKETSPAAYLLKPASKKQIDVAIDFALTKNVVKGQGSTAQYCPFVKRKGFYFVKVGSRYQKISIKEITHLQAAGSSCVLYAGGRKIVVSGSLNSVLKQMNEDTLVRSHRSWAVNLDFIDSYDDHDIYIIDNGEVLVVPIGRAFKASLKAYFPKIMSE